MRMGAVETAGKCNLLASLQVRRTRWGPLSVLSLPGAGWSDSEPVGNCWGPLGGAEVGSLPSSGRENRRRRPHDSEGLMQEGLSGPWRSSGEAASLGSLTLSPTEYRTGAQGEPWELVVRGRGEGGEEGCCVDQGITSGDLPASWIVFRER